MKFDQLLYLVANEPVFETSLLLAGEVDPDHVRRQLSRWAKAGKVHQLRRGVYAVAPPYARLTPHPFVVANVMVTASYVSAQSALAYYGMIPEYVSAVTSVTRSRPRSWQTPLGRFLYRHIQSGLFTGFNRMDLGKGQFAFVARPEKALLDLVYFEPGGDDRAFLDGLRLQRLEQLDLAWMEAFARQSGMPKLCRAVGIVLDLAAAETASFTEL